MAQHAWRSAMKVSIVIPAHNEEALLPDCLRALAAQDYDGALEIIVVDNASTDRTAEVARFLGASVVPEPRRDYCLALIRGFAAATGSIIAMTDADTVVPPDWVSRLVEEYRRRPDVVAIGGDVVFTGANWKGWLLARVLVPAFNWIDRRNPRGPHLWGANLSVRRNAFLAGGGRGAGRERVLAALERVRQDLLARRHPPEGRGAHLRRRPERALHLAGARHP